LSLFVTAARSERPALSLLRTGSFHGGEVRARSGERWIGLFPSGDGFAWRSATLITRRVEDLCEAADGEKTGIEVAIKEGEPIFLLKGLSRLPTKNVQPAHYTPFGLELPPSEALKLDLPGTGKYKLRVIDRRQDDAAPPSPSSLLLESTGQKQILHEWPHGLRDEHCELIWAGDLDGDGKLDLFMALSDHYAVIDYTLFLSLKRSKGNLVQRVAAFTINGC
jgi:hypothetical protein